LHLVLLGGICLSGGCKSWWGEKAPESPVVPVLPPGKSLVNEPPPFTPASTKGDNIPPFVPGKTSSAAHGTDTSSGVQYTVKNGDSLWKVSKKYGISIASLAASNNIPADKGLKIGQVLHIPAGAKVVAAESSAAKTSASGKKAAVTKATLTAPSSESKSSRKDKAEKSESSSDSSTYIVKAGDTLAKIASKNHIKLETLAKANGVDSKKQLKVGQKIVIPKSGTSVAAPESKAGKDKKDKAEKSEKTEKNASKKDAKKDSKKDLAAKSDKSDASAAAPAKAGSKLDAKAKEAIDNLDKNTTEVSTDSIEDMDKEAAKSSTRTDTPKAETKPAAAGSAPETVDISEETTIQAVSTRYGVKVDDLKKANPGLPSNGKLTPGMIIVLP
jgi:LysM repeat protein